MRKLLFIIISTATMGCSAKASLPSKTVMPVDTNLYYIDTIVQLGSGRELAITRYLWDNDSTKLNADDLDWSPIILHFIDKKETVQRTSCTENLFSNIKIFDDRIYLTVLESGGGSGYIASLYKVSLSNFGTLDTVISYSELTYPYFNKSGTELLLFSGFWNMEDEDEAHFSEHIYFVDKINLLEKGFPITELGSTRKKYVGPDGRDDVKRFMTELNKSEPAVFKNVDLSTYP